MTSFPASVCADSGDSELCSPPQGRRPSQPLLTIAEEEEVAVDPVRRGAQLESHDEDDDKSVGDTMDTFDYIRRRRSIQRIKDANEDNDDDDEETRQVDQVAEDIRNIVRRSNDDLAAGPDRQ